MTQRTFEGVVRSSTVARALRRRAGLIAVQVGPETEGTVILGRGVGPETPMEIGSLTKAFTGLLMADMLGRNEIQMTSRMDEVLFCEPWPGDGPITVLDLATHMTGLPRLSFRPRFASLNDPYREVGRDHILEWLARHRPTRAAVPEFSYSNFGFAVLGLVLERAGSAAYGALMRERLLEPLGLSKTQLQMAQGPDLVSEGFGAIGLRASPWHFDAYAPCGALVSTAGDLAKALRGFLDERSVASSLFAAATKERRSVPGGSIGLAWMTSANGAWHWHNGGTGGYSAYLALSPERKVGVVLLMNQAGAQPLTELGQALMRELTDAAQTVPPDGGSPCREQRDQVTATERR